MQRCWIYFWLLAALCPPEFAVAEEQPTLRETSGEPYRKPGADPGPYLDQKPIKPVTLDFEGRIAGDSGGIVRDKRGAIDDSDTTDIRFLRFGILGAVYRDFLYRATASYENEELEAKDLYVGYSGLANTEFLFGQQREFTGIEYFSSGLDIWFLERSSGMTPFTPPRQVGLTAKTHLAKRFGAQFGLFGGEVLSVAPDDHGYGYTARVYGLPYQSTDTRLHIGAMLRHRIPGSDSAALALRTRGESTVIPPALVDTRGIRDVSDYTIIGAEAYLQHGPFSVMTEFNEAYIARDGRANLQYRGGYLSTSYFLTGESRPYRVETGTYDGIAPTSPVTEGGFGGWEIVGRFSFADLNDADLRRGRVSALGAALNWYPTEETRLMLNYIANDLDQYAAFPNEDPQYLMMRAQAWF